jgi:hypothetical protein
MDIERLYKALVGMDKTDEIAKKFDEAREEGGLGWAVDRYAEHVINAQQTARIVRPLISMYPEMQGHEWIARVREQRDRIIRDLVIHLHGRSNSTSMMQNAINHWEAEAMSNFVSMLEYCILD